MNNTIISARNKFFHFGYTKLLKKIFFRLDPEKVHDHMTRNGVMLGSNPLTRSLTSLMFSYKNPVLEQDILGIHFPNPIGLAAGFDKNAQLVDILPSVGFGFAEVGSITGEPCEGNPKPRLWRLPKSKSLVVYYGLKNDGSEVLANKLSGKDFRIPIGISVAKTNNKETIDTQKGLADYAKAYRAFADIGAYTTINISCPNAFGGEPFTDPSKLDLLLSEIDKIPTKKPIFLKISPDLQKDSVDEIIEVCNRHLIHGFICANLTKNRSNPKIKDSEVPEKGGISGKVQEDLANDLIRYVYQKTRGEYIIIGCGGVSSAEDAYKKIKSGASLIQMITGMIFEGPQIVSEINRGLVSLLKDDGYANISDAIGTANKITENVNQS